MQFSDALCWNRGEFLQPNAGYTSRELFSRGIKQSSSFIVAERYHVATQLI